MKKIIVIGNSIASGYNMLGDLITPFALQLKDVMGDKNEYISFARAQNNSDMRVMLDWLYRSPSKISCWKMMDYSPESSVKMACGKIDKRFGAVLPEKSLYEMLSEEGAEYTIVYFGLTGSFLDRLTRGGTITSALAGFEQDARFCEMFCSYVYAMNYRYSSMNRIFLCGAPHLHFMIDRKMKKIANRWPHVSFIPGVTNCLLHRNAKGKMGIDIHYSPEGYKKMAMRVADIIESEDPGLQEKILIERSLRRVSDGFEYYGQKYEMMRLHKEDLGPSYCKEIAPTLCFYVEQGKGH